MQFKTPDLRSMMRPGLLALPLFASLTLAHGQQIDEGGDQDQIGVQRYLRLPELTLPDRPIVNTPTVTITGVASDGILEVTAPKGVFQFPVTGNQFTAEVDLELDQINHLSFVSIFTSGLRTAAVPAVITHDTQAPNVFIDFPADGAEVTVPEIDVAGRVGDSLSGFMMLEVSVNGVTSEVDPGIGTNGTFLAKDVPLMDPGVPTILVATARDYLGNEKTTQITVTQVVCPPNSPTITIDDLTNGQTGVVGDQIPIRVTVLKADGSPFVNKVVTFEVTRSDGHLTDTQGEVGGSIAQVHADMNGIAEAFWTLGSDAGCGNNRVEVTSTDICGTTLFCASADPAGAAQINVGSGTNQRCEAGAPAPEPLVVWVSDGRNGVMNVEVVFQVKQGGGSFGGEKMIMVDTDVTGHRQVDFTPGSGLNVVEATIRGSSTPATFQLFGVSRTEETTTFAGLVLDNSQRPIQGAEVTLEVAGCELPKVISDLAGQFRFEDIPTSGSGHLFVNGLTAFHVGGAPGQDVPVGSFPALQYMTTVVEDAANRLPTPVLLPPLDPLNADTFDASADVELTVRALADPEDPMSAVEVLQGLKMIVDKDTTVSLPDGTKVGPNDPGMVTLALNQVQFDEIPMPMPDGAAPPFAWTLQPAGAEFDRPIRIEMPNMVGLAPGAIMYFLSFDHDTERFEIVATGSVSPDGLTMVSDPGSGIVKSGWGGFCPPYPNTGNANCSPYGDGEGPYDPNHKCPNTCDIDSPIDPVNFFSGEFYLEETDLRIRGRGTDFVWARKYRSKIGPDTAQGNSWDFSYNTFLRKESPPDEEDLLLSGGSGRTDNYRLQEPDRWARNGFFRDLTRDPGTGIYTLEFAHLEKWTFHPLDGSPAEGKIASMVDRNGNTILFEYDGQGRLWKIYDTLHTVSNPRVITLAYDGDFIESVTDFAGRQVLYEYYQDGDAGGSAGDLKSVTTPEVVATAGFPVPPEHEYDGGKTTIYTYSKGSQDERLNDNLLTVTDPKGQIYLRNTYATTEADGDLLFDRIVSQAWGEPDEVIDLVYEPLTPTEANNGAVIQTILNDRVGNVKAYFYDDWNRGVLEREYTGRWPADQATTKEDLDEPPPTPKLRDDDPAFFETRYEWNDDFLLTRTTFPDGNEEVVFNECDLNPSVNPKAGANVRVRAWKPGKHAFPGDQELIIQILEYDADLSGGGCCGSNFVTRAIDGRGNETLHEYDDRGNRTKTIHRISSIEEDFEYNLHGQMTARVWPDNGSGHRRRDEFGYYSSGPQEGYLEEEVVDPGMETFHLNLTTRYEYNRVGQVVRIIDPRDNDTQFVVNQLDQVVRSVSREVEAGSQIRYTVDTFYDLNDNVARIDVENARDDGTVDPENPWFSTLYDYEILNYPIRECREAGSHDVPRGSNPQLDCTNLPSDEFITTEFEYDGNRNQVVFRDGEAAEGRQETNAVRTLYDERDLVFHEVRGYHPTIADPDLSTTQYDYDGNKNPRLVTQGLEGVAPRKYRLRYDSYQRLVREVDPMGNVTLRSYDANRNVVEAQVDGERTDVEKKANNVKLSRFTFTYDPMDRAIVRGTDFFDADGNDLVGGQVTGKSIQTTQYTDSSQVHVATNDNGHSTTFEYDRANRIEKITDARGNEVTYGYDANSDVTSITELDLTDVAGNPDEGFETTFTYDGLDRQTSETDNVGNTTSSAYDSRENLTRVVDALGNITEHAYDGIDRLIETKRILTDDGTGNGNEVGQIVTTQAWDDSSRLVAQADDSQHATRYAYDALNRVIVTQMADGTLHQVGQGATWDLADDEPNLLGFTSGYDINDNPEFTSDANESVVQTTFDLLDRPVHRLVFPGIGVSSDTTFETYQYDGLSRIVSALDDDSVVLRTYDSLSSVLTDVVDGQETECVYDGVGNEVQKTYPGGRVITCAYDVLERKETITDETGGGSTLIATYDYVGPSRVARREYGNDTRCDDFYDGATGVPNEPGDFGVRRLERTRHVFDPDSPVLIDERTYKWDPLYNKLQRKDVRAGGPQLTHDYTYDSIYRLRHTLVTDAGQVTVRDESYGLDGVGNRTTVTGGSNHGAYVLDNTLPEPADAQVNQYTSTPHGADPDDDRKYDQNGNQIEVNDPVEGLRTIRYDYRNRMIEYVDGGIGERHLYAYDPLGRRIRRVVDADGQADETRYLYDGWQVCEERDGVNVVLASYVYGNYVDEVIAMQRGGQDFFYHADDLYGVVAVTDSSGGTEERYEYHDYGEPEFFDGNGVPLTCSEINSPYGFTGRRLDSETAWYYYRTRYLDALSGRFVTRDSIGIWGAFNNVGNGYSYVANRPTTLADPMGLDDIRVENGRVYHQLEGAFGWDGDRQEVGTLFERNGVKFVKFHGATFPDMQLADLEDLGGADSTSELFADIMRRRAAERSEAAKYTALHNSGGNAYACLGFYLTAIPGVENVAMAVGGADWSGNRIEGWDRAGTGAIGLLQGGATYYAPGLAYRGLSRASTMAGAGPLSAWVRVHRSYSKIGGFHTEAMVWGSNAHFRQQIRNLTLRTWNQRLRESRIPGSNWRFQDAGHLHAWKAR